MIVACFHRLPFCFQIVFVQDVGTIYDAGVAIDDVVFTECQLKPPQDDCGDSEFHCAETRVSLGDVHE